MNEQELQELRAEVLKQMEDAYTQEGMARLLDMIISFHSCEGGAYYHVHDYLRTKGY